MGSNPPNQRFPDLPVLTSSKLSIDVMRYLRDALVSGQFEPGQRLAPRDLASRLGVSTMPVREALVSLSNEGLLDVLPRRGFRVAEFQLGDIEDAFRVHAYVAGLLAEEAAMEISDSTIAELRTINRRIEDLGRSRRTTARRAAEIEQLNFDFHRTINRIPNAPRLRWFLRAATRHVPRHFYDKIPGWVDATVDDHPKIIDALSRHDGARARQLVEAHVTRAGSLVVSNLSARGIWADRAPRRNGVGGDLPPPNTARVVGAG